ncbi:homing endonuclease associated repeat-containing protein [Thermoanaerobacterium thermosaccharolyticum]|uniref:homing endonuclease associated repeat-containing protein n=1 Tax=Thermoanaerobacterium thermosaccharolyticum TaxID=1517 RepID=UPI003DA97780
MRYSDEELIRYLKELYTELGRTPRKRDLKKYSYDAYRKHFGSFNNALIKAGLSVNRRFYSDADILGWIQNFYKTNGRSPYESEFIKLFGDFTLFTRRWGTWSNTLKAAKVPVRASFKSLSDDEMLDRLIEVCKTLGRVPKRLEFSKYGLPSPTTYIEHFGMSAANLLKKHGYIFIYSFRKNMSEQQLIDELKEIVRLLGHVPSISEIDRLAKNSIYSSSFIYRKFFGSWNNALKKAGFEPNSEALKGLSDEEIMNIAKKIYEAYGTLNAKLMVKHGVTKSQIERHGGMIRLKKALNIPCNDRTKYTKDDCINGLNEAYQYFGHLPSINEYNSRHFKPSYKTIIKHFKTWKNALEELKKIINFSS